MPDLSLETGGTELSPVSRLAEREGQVSGMTLTSTSPHPGEELVQWVSDPHYLIRQSPTQGEGDGEGRHRIIPESSFQGNRVDAFL